MSLESFLDYLKVEKNSSKHTVISYRTDLNSFLSFYKKQFQSSNLAEANYGEIRSWIVSLVDLGLSNRTINRKVSALNSYYKFLIKTSVLDINPLSRHKALKTKKKVIVPFSQPEIDAVLNFIDSCDDDFESIRNKFMVELFYSTGIRRMELIELKLKDIDASNNTLKVLGKRNKERIIPLLNRVKGSYTKYLSARESLKEIYDNDSLFLTSRGRKIYETLVYRIINDYFSRASSKEKCSPHVLRHSFATHLLNEGANLNAVKELLGHTSLAATQVYTHNSIAELKKVYVRSHPRSGK